MLVSKLFLIVFLVQAFAKDTQLDSSTKKNSAYINLSNMQCQCINETFCKFEQCRLKAVGRNEAHVFINATIFQGPITNCKLNIDMYRKSTGYNSIPFNVTVDACQFLENTEKNPILHNIYQMVANVSNLNHTCPYYERNIVVQNLSTKYTQFFSFVPSGRYMAKTRWIVNGLMRAIVTLWIELHNPENIFYPEGLRNIMSS